MRCLFLAAAAALALCASAVRDDDVTGTYGDVYAVVSTRYIDDTMSDVSKQLCAEVAEVEKVFDQLCDQCDQPLANLINHFGYKAFLLQKHHFAQTLSRNAVVTATARRAIVGRQKPPVMAFTPMPDHYSADYAEVDEQVSLATMRLVNARQMAKETMASFDQKFMANVADFSRYCSDGGKPLVAYLNRMLSETTSSDTLSGILGPKIDSVSEHEKQIVALAQLTDPCSHSRMPLADTIDDLLARIKERRQSWMDPLRDLSQLWSDSNREYAKDVTVDAAVLNFALHGGADNAASPNGNGNTWKEDMARAEVIEKLERQQAAQSRQRLVRKLPQNRPQTDRLQTETSEVQEDVARAEENVAASTATIAASYRDFAITMNSQLQAAALRGVTGKALKATQKQIGATADLARVVSNSASVVQEAASISGRWEPPKLHTTPMSVSTTLRLSKAPKTVYGDVALAVQRVRGMQQESNAAARAGDAAKHAKLDQELVAARQHLEEQVQKMQEHHEPLPDLVAVKDASAKRDQAVAKEVELRTAVIKKVSERDAAFKKGRARSDTVLSNEDRLQKLQSEVTGIVRASEAERANRELMMHHVQLIQAQHEANLLAKRRQGGEPEGEEEK